MGWVLASDTFDLETCVLFSEHLCRGADDIRMISPYYKLKNGHMEVYWRLNNYPGVDNGLFKREWEIMCGKYRRLTRTLAQMNVEAYRDTLGWFVLSTMTQL